MKLRKMLQLGHMLLSISKMDHMPRKSATVNEHGMSEEKTNGALIYK